MPTLQFNITKEQQLQLNEIKKETGVILKKLAQQAIADYIKKHEAKKWSVDEYFSFLGGFNKKEVCDE